MRFLLRLAEGLAAIAVVLALSLAYWPRPQPPGVAMPFQEVSARLSADGRILCFTGQRGALPALFGRRGSYRGADDFCDVFWTEIGSGQLHCLTPNADGTSFQAAISPNGRYIAFGSEASNLVEGDRNGCSDIFLYDREQKNLRRLAPPRERAGTCPSYDPAVSDLPLVAFNRYQGTDNHLLLSDGTLADVGAQRGPLYGAPSFSPDGTRLAGSFFESRVEAGGVRRTATIQRLELREKTVLPVSLGVSAPCFSPSLARDRCAFVSAASGHYDVYVRDFLKNETWSVTQGDEDSLEPSISADGRYIAFTSYTGGPISQVYLFDAQNRTTKLVSHGIDGPSYGPSLCADGSRVAFLTRVPPIGGAAGGGTRVPASVGQLYIWDRVPDRLTRVPLQ